jgi:hypothetical protein
MKLELLKSRSFGVMLADTFKFLQQNLKPFSKGLFVIVLPLLLAYITVSYLFFSSYFLYFNMSNIQYINPSIPAQMLWIIPMFLLLGIASVFIAATTVSYTKLYAEDSEREILPSLLWKEIKQYFWRIAGANLLLMLAAIFAVAVIAFIFGGLIGNSGIGGIILVFFIFLLLALAAVYFSTKLIFFPVAIIIENKSIIQSFKDSYSFTKGIFWKLFLFVLLLSLMISTAVQILNLPGMVLTYLKMFINVGIFTQHLANVLMALASSLGLLLYSVMYIGIAIFYFSEKEQRCGIAASRQIDEIGRKED